MVVLLGLKFTDEIHGLKHTSKNDFSELKISRTQKNVSFVWVL